MNYPRTLLALSLASVLLLSGCGAGSSSTGSARSGDCAHPAAKKIAANNHANICFIGFLLYSLFESFSKSVSSIPLPGVWVPGDMSVTAKGVARA